MKKCLKKTLIILTAILCAFSISILVSAAGLKASTKENALDGNLNGDEFRDWLDDLFNGAPTTSPNNDSNGETTTSSQNNNPTNTTAASPSNTTSPPPPLTGSWTAPATTYPYQNYYTTAPSYYYPQVVDPNAAATGALTTTVEATTLPGVVVPEEESSSKLGSLSDLFEDDTVAALVEKPTEPYTIPGPLVVQNAEEGGFTWQKAALVGALVLFVVLASLIVALIIQRNKNSKRDEKDVLDDDFSSKDKEPVPVEVMSRDRIAELLGIAPASSQSGDVNISSADSAAAIKVAAMMDKLAGSYNDPLLKKYADESDIITGGASSLDENNVDASEILKATDSMLNEITGGEKYASDADGANTDSDNTESGSNESPLDDEKYCPECHKPVSSEDVFCRSCGAYVG